MKKVTNREASRLIKTEQPFVTRTGNLHGERIGGRKAEEPWKDWGWAAYAWKWPLRYIVWSWYTPIAWVDNYGTAVVTFERHSSTTSSKHMPAVYGIDRWVVPKDKRIVASRLRWWEQQREEMLRLKREAANARARDRRAEDRRNRLRREEERRLREERILQENQMIAASISGQQLLLPAIVDQEVIALFGGTSCGVQ